MTVDPTRSRIMKAVGQKHTAPEMRVRKTLHSLGYRFRVQRKDLPGRPDVVLPRHKIAIFVHGCFWHRHENCPKATTPKTRAEFWAQKFRDNVDRDRRQMAALLQAGWRVLVVWECETKSGEVLSSLLDGYIKGDRSKNNA